MSAELVAFIRDRLADDEETARKATARQSGGDTWTYDGTDVRAASGLTVARRQVPVLAEHIALHDPDRVLTEVEAKRRAIAPYAVALEECQAIRAQMREVIHKDHDEFARLHRRESELIEAARILAPVVGALALPYAEHSDYRHEWASGTETER